MDAGPDGLRLPDAIAAASVTRISADSRTVRPGDLFIAISGTKTDGRTLAAGAIASGAAAAIGEGDAPCGVPADRWLSVRSARQAHALLATAALGHPERSLRIFGVTGTNGKTTTATLLHELLNAAGVPCGLISTVRCVTGVRDIPSLHTTPDPETLFSLFAEMRDAKMAAVSMEVSSHALDQQRTAGIRFDGAAFTNLTRDHLDYHGTPEAYGAAKKRLFDGLRPDGQSLAVLNSDDPFGATLARDTIARGVRTVTYSTAAGTKADYCAEILESTTEGIRFRLRTPSSGFVSSTRLFGAHNMQNLLAAIALASQCDLTPAMLERVIPTLQPVRGRLERVRSASSPAACFVDYAHTPDALERAIAALRPATHGRLVVVFGCGGDRDRGKRPLMGACVHAMADIAVVTSDNPRSERPGDIIADILAGIPTSSSESGSATVLVEPDRRLAIRKAISLATSPGDTVLVAGKGHETTQTVNGRDEPFDDREELLQ